MFIRVRIVVCKLGFEQILVVVAPHCQLPYALIPLLLIQRVGLAIVISDHTRLSEFPPVSIFSRIDKLRDKVSQLGLERSGGVSTENFGLNDTLSELCQAWMCFRSQVSFELVTIDETVSKQVRILGEKEENHWFFGFFDEVLFHDCRKLLNRCVSLLHVGVEDTPQVSSVDAVEVIQFHQMIAKER